jgi:hypothetical protein
MKALLPVGQVLNTAYIERLNATVGQRLGSLVRRSRCLVRQRSTLEAGRYLVGCVYNFCTPHKSLRQEQPDARRKWVECLPQRRGSIVFEGFLPWILWSCGYLSATLDRPMRREWEKWSELVERGVDSDWANEVLNANAPGGRCSAALVGRFWPDECKDEIDPIGVKFLAQREYFDAIVTAFQDAYDRAGVDGNASSQDIQKLQTWFWNRAGLSLTARFGLSRSA